MKDQAPAVRSPARADRFVTIARLTSNGLHQRWIYESEASLPVVRLSNGGAPSRRRSLPRSLLSFGPVEQPVRPPRRPRSRQSLSVLTLGGKVLMFTNPRAFFTAG